MNPDVVIAVNDRDEVQGYLDKLEAHQKGILHRAVSVFIFNTKGEWLLQQRATEKYHSSGLWSNACCTHPMRGESAIEAAQRRLEEEMGMRASIKKLFSFQYKASLDKGLIENELDHVYMGVSDETPSLNQEEVSNYRYISTENLIQELNERPQDFTEWFKLLFDPIFEEVKR